MPHSFSSLPLSFKPHTKTLHWFWSTTFRSSGPVYDVDELGSQLMILSEARNAAFVNIKSRSVCFRRPIILMPWTWWNWKINHKLMNYECIIILQFCYKKFKKSFAHFALYAVISALFDHNFDPLVVLSNIRKQLHVYIRRFNGDPTVVFQRICRVSGANHNQWWHMRAIRTIDGYRERMDENIFMHFNSNPMLSRRQRWWWRWALRAGTLPIVWWTIQ